jgi:hypothetical protein
MIDEIACDQSAIPVLVNAPINGSEPPLCSPDKMESRPEFAITAP